MTKSSARNIFIGGTLFFAAVFLILTYKSLSSETLSKRTHPENISDKVVWGKRIWERNACIDCHTLLGEGAYYAPELGNVIKRRGEAGVRAILKTDALQGWGTVRKMPKFNLSEKDIDGLVEFFKWVGRIDTNNWPPNEQG